MVRINLLPVKQIKQLVTARNQVVAFFVSLILLLVLIFGVGLTRVMRINSLNAAIHSLEIEKNSYQSTINEIEKLKKDKAKLETKLATIKKLKKGSHITVRILDDIANLVPADRMWLSSLTQTPASLKLGGVALDNETIAQFMQRLKESPLFRDAELVNSSLNVVAGQKLKAFSLTCSLTPVDAGEADVNKGKTPQVTKKNTRKKARR
jgi:type IV pilus assembly protein PilN